MKKFRVMFVRYGYAVIEAEDEAEALEKANDMKTGDFDWSSPEDGQVIEEVDY